MASKALAQHGEQPLAVSSVFEPRHKIIRVPLQLATAMETRLRFVFEPADQHRVHEDVGEYGRDFSPCATGNFTLDRRIEGLRQRPKLSLRRTEKYPNGK